VLALRLGSDTIQLRTESLISAIDGGGLAIRPDLLALSIFICFVCVRHRMTTNSTTLLMRHQPDKGIFDAAACRVAVFSAHSLSRKWGVLDVT
jgi:hypothetical protein